MRHTVFEPRSVPLEDPILTPFKLVGSPEWFDTAFIPGVVLEREKVVISDRSQLQPILTQLRGMTIIGVDTETTGNYRVRDKGFSMNPVNRGTRIVLMQIGNEDQVWLIEPALIPYFKDILENDKQLHLAHNWEFDFKWLMVKYGIRPRRLYCSMLAEQLLTAGLLGYKAGLADCARKYPPSRLVSKAVRSEFVHLGNERMTRKMIKYAARDVPLLFPIFRAQIKELALHELNKVAKLEFENIPVAAEMEAGGFELDPDKLQLLITYWNGLKDSMGQEILETISKRLKDKDKLSYIVPDWPYVFKLNSNAKKLAALNDIGITLPDAKRATLLTNSDPVAQLLAKYSAVVKMTSTYGKNLLDKINPLTGRCHPRFFQMGQGSGEEGLDTKETTATGRWAGDAQQFPRKSDGLYGSISAGSEEDLEVSDCFAVEIAEAMAKYAQKEKASIEDEVKLREGVHRIYLGQWATESDKLNKRGPRHWYLNPLDGRKEWRVPEIRECIVARKGYKVLAADYSQIEIKLMAFLSEDPGLLKALNARDASGEPTDIHCYISAMVYGEKLGFTYEDMITVIKEKAPGGKKHPRYKEFKRMRSNIKTTTFGVTYGSGAQGVAARCGITEAEAQQVIDDFFKQFPRLKVWLEQQGNHALRYGYTETPYGRKRFYDVPSRTDFNAEEYDAEIHQICRQAGNHPIQGASADMLKDALRLIYSEIRGEDIDGSDRYDKLNGPKVYDAHIILVLHDEIVIECREDQVEELKLLMEKCMAKAYDSIIGSDISNKVDVAVGSSWGKA